MAIHKPYDRTFFINSVMTEGFSLDLTKGQFGVFDTTSQTAKGSAAVTALEDFKSYELRLGNRQKLTRTTSNKSYSSFPFEKSDIISLVKSSAHNTEVKVDQVEVTIPEMYPCQNKNIVIELSGKAMEYLGLADGVGTVLVPIDTPCGADVCADPQEMCTPVERGPLIDAAVEYLNAFEFRGGAKFTDYVEVTPIKTSTKFGLKLKGKVFKLSTGEELKDKIAYIEDSVMLRVGGGYITDFNYSTTGGRVQDTPFDVNYLSRYEPRTHVGGNLEDEEQRSATFFTGRMMNYDYMGRLLSGNESNIINQDAQYVFYALTIKRQIFSQGLSQQVTEYITYHLAIESGKETALETLLSGLLAGTNAKSDLDVATEEPAPAKKK